MTLIKFPLLHILKHYLKNKWEEKFLKVFEGCFSKNQELLDKLKIKFKNYKFNKKNMVDDYSILFFTFCLYEMMSDKCEKKSQIA